MQDTGSLKPNHQVTSIRFSAQFGLVFASAWFNFPFKMDKFFCPAIVVHSLIVTHLCRIMNWTNFISKLLVIFVNRNIFISITYPAYMLLSGVADCHLEMPFKISNVGMLMLHFWKIEWLNGGNLVYEFDVLYKNR